MSYSYATDRKIKIIEKKLGTDWKEQNPNRSIDAIYNELVGDRRKNLFCKIDPTRKQHLDEMIDIYDIKMSELIERLIDQEYFRFVEVEKTKTTKIIAQFGHND